MHSFHRQVLFSLGIHILRSLHYRSSITERVFKKHKYIFTYKAILFLVKDVNPFSFSFYMNSLGHLKFLIIKMCFFWTTETISVYAAFLNGKISIWKNSSKCYII